jgi:hypothetical protein
LDPTLTHTCPTRGEPTPEHQPTHPFTLTPSISSSSLSLSTLSHSSKEKEEEGEGKEGRLKPPAAEATLSSSPFGARRRQARKEELESPRGDLASPSSWGAYKLLLLPLVWIKSS